MPGRTTEGPSSQHQDEAREDAVMQDAPEANGQDGEQDAMDWGDEEPEGLSVSILPGSTDQAASFQFVDEGHTLGNALRWIIMKNPNVELCAYTIPHPSEPKMNLRIQTWEGLAIDALSKGLRELAAVCDVVTDEFTAKITAFEESS